jgi:hypothetical protein
VAQQLLRTESTKSLSPLPVSVPPGDLLVVGRRRPDQLSLSATMAGWRPRWVGSSVDALTQLGRLDPALVVVADDGDPGLFTLLAALRAMDVPAVLMSTSKDADSTARLYGAIARPPVRIGHAFDAWLAGAEHRTEDS